MGATTADRLAERLDMTADAFPDYLAIVHGDQRLTWGEVADESKRIARAMLGWGLGVGDHVALWLPNHPEWLVLWLAAVRIGVTVVPVNTKYKPAEAAYVIAKSDAKMLFIEETFLDTNYVAAFECICPDWRPDNRHSDHLPMLRDVVVLGASAGPESYSEFLQLADDVPDVRLCAAQDTVPFDTNVIIVFTSGTTGFPKGVMHTHDVLRMVDTVARWFEIGPEDRILGHMPLFHVSGVFSSFMLALVTGGALIQLDRWSAPKALELIEAERVTVLSGIPTHFADLLAHPDLADYDTMSLRTGWIGGTYIPVDVVRGAAEVLGMEALLPVYGLTEATSCTTLGRKADPQESLLLGKGVTLGGYEVAVVDPDTRTPVGVGTVGEVAIRGYVVMKGYYKDPEATAAVMDANGWFYTGDLGAFDAAGYLAITGRRSAKFIVGGNNVHPADIERVLMDCDGVKAACVVPRPDERLGEVAVAFVEVAHGHPQSEEEVLAHARDRLAPFKVPRHVVFVDGWSMTSTGKVNLADLQRLAATLS